MSVRRPASEPRGIGYQAPLKYCVEIFLETSAHTIVADASLLHATERRGVIGDQAPVDPHHAGGEPLAEPS